MEDKMFDKLCESIEQATAHMKGEKDLDRDQIHFVDEPDPREIRSKLGLTQAEFANLLDVPVSTVRNWEQGRRQPRGPAEMLLRVADRNPQALLDVLGATKDEPEMERQVTRKIRLSARAQWQVQFGDRALDTESTSTRSEITASAQSGRRDEETRSADDYSYAMAV